MTGHAFSIVPRPGAAPHMPLAVLHACHQAILRHCRTLRRLVLHVAERGQSLEVQIVSHTLLRFFDIQVPRHYVDEEQHLFPALIDSMAGSDAVCLRDLTRGSIEQHRVLAAEWGKLRGSLEHIAAGRLIPLASSDVEAFATRWNDHIGIEETELLPMAPRLLSDNELAAIDLRMQW